MRALLLMTAAFVIAGVAAAQDTTMQPAAPVAAQAPFEPKFERYPALRRLYPQRAPEEGVAGLVNLCCSAEVDRSIDCRVALEWPANYGFGEAARRYADDFRLTEASAAEFTARNVNAFPIAVRYQVGEASPSLDQLAAQVSERARDQCGVGTGSAEYIVVTASRGRRR